jgi:hypothetical protein
MSEPAADDFIEIRTFGRRRQKLSVDLCRHVAIVVEAAVPESDFQAPLGRVVSDVEDRLGLD